MASMSSLPSASGSRPPPVVCPDCKRSLEPGERAWRCRPCDRLWPAVLGIPDFRPEAGGERPAEIDRLVEAYPRAGFAELVALRTPSFTTDDPALKAIYIDYREAMANRGGAFYRMVRDRLAELWAAPRSGCALVIGCGVGAGIRELAADFERVVGIDPDLGDLILAKKAAEEQGVAERVTLVQGYAQAMPLADGSIDLAVAEDVLEHVIDLEGTFDELGRVLAPGGQFAGNSVNRYNMLRPEPHVRLWFLGLLPRALQGRYALWRRRFRGYDEYCRLPSWRELSQALRRGFGTGGRVVFPGVEVYGFPGALDRVLRILERLGPLSLPLLWVFPSHLAIARKEVADTRSPG